MTRSTLEGINEHIHDLGADVVDEAGSGLGAAIRASGIATSFGAHVEHRSALAGEVQLNGTMG